MSATSQMLTTLHKAARLRASGATWAKVAAELGTTEGGAKVWPTRYRSEWADIYQQAHDAVVAEAEAEAWHTQRHLLRSAESEAVRQSAAHSIMTIAQKTRPVRVVNEGRVQVNIIRHYDEEVSDGS